MIDTRVAATVAVSVVVIAAAMTTTLTGSPIAVAYVNTQAPTYLGSSRHRLSACQPYETLPRETTAIRLRSEAFLGPRVEVDVVSSGRLIAHGERPSGWTGGVVTVPVNPLARTYLGVEVCYLYFVNGDESLDLVGEKTRGELAAHSGGRRLTWRLQVEYLRPASSSWWSLVPEVLRRMGLGRAPGGTLDVVLFLGLTGGLVLVSCAAVLRGLR